MEISKQLPLTETTYIILLALKSSEYGYVVMQRVEKMSDGRVRIVAGTMYDKLDNTAITINITIPIFILSSKKQGTKDITSMEQRMRLLFWLRSNL